MAVLPPGSGIPTGSVTFTGPGGLSETVALDATGEACFTSTTLTSGTVTAVYTPDASCFATSTGTVAVTVTAASTTTTVSATPASSVCGQPVDVCATVAVLAPGSGTPTGSVTFTGPGGLSETVALDATGEACFTSSELVTGTVTAVYTPDASCFATSTGTVAVTVDAASTTTTVTADPAGSVCGQPVDVCATVAVLPPGSGIPTGSVTFTGPGGLSETVTLDATGEACFTSTTLTSGTVTAVYTPDASCFATSTGTVAVTVTAAPVLVSISPSAGPVSGTSSVTLSGTNLTGVTGVTIGGQAGINVQVLSDTEITFDAPAHAAGMVQVTVTNPCGTSNTQNFTYQGPPTLTITPSSVAACQTFDASTTGAPVAATHATFTYDGAPVQTLPLTGGAAGP
ncbi:Ig-like domain repeat protein, partial [Streptomyces sioyaensis]|uniref:Ig-like domain repeat protein n=1 Tax=Streptomyces sioyaensis TaxID=67364 RepID=UPI0036E6FD8B